MRCATTIRRPGSTILSDPMRLGGRIQPADNDAHSDNSTSRPIAVINLRYPGQYYDRETGFFYNGARYYDPETGRYVSSDPMGLQGGINTYAYGMDNPLRYSDPTGLCWEDGCIGEIAGGGLLGGGVAFGMTWYETGSFTQGLEAIPGGAIGGAALVVTGSAEALSFAWTAAATFFDTFVTAADDAWAVSNTTSTSSTSGSGTGPVCPP